MGDFVGNGMVGRADLRRWLIKISTYKLSRRSADAIADRIFTLCQRDKMDFHLFRTHILSAVHMVAETYLEKHKRRRSRANSNAIDKLETENVTKDPLVHTKKSPSSEKPRVSTRKSSGVADELTRPPTEVITEVEMAEAMSRETNSQTI